MEVAPACLNESKCDSVANLEARSQVDVLVVEKTDNKTDSKRSSKQYLKNIDARRHYDDHLIETIIQRPGPRKIIHQLWYYGSLRGRLKPGSEWNAKQLNAQSEYASTALKYVAT